MVQKANKTYPNKNKKISETNGWGKAKLYGMVMGSDSEKYETEVGEHAPASPSSSQCSSSTLHYIREGEGACNSDRDPGE